MTVEQQFQYLIENMVTKKDMEELKQSTKADIEELKQSTKTDMEELKQSTKADIEELRQSVTMEMQELKQSVKEDMQSMKMELYDEIVRAEKNIDSNSEMLKSLNNKYDTLLLKTDNTDLLFLLINKQANEVDELKARLDIVEKKIS